jgi:hypothetical protein
MANKRRTIFIFPKSRFRGFLYSPSRPLALFEKRFPRHRHGFPVKRKTRPDIHGVPGPLNWRPIIHTAWFRPGGAPKTFRRSHGSQQERFAMSQKETSLPTLFPTVTRGRPERFHQQRRFPTAQHHLQVSTMFVLFLQVNTHLPNDTSIHCFIQLRSTNLLKSKHSSALRTELRPTQSLGQYPISKR